MQKPPLEFDRSCTGIGFEGREYLAGFDNIAFVARECFIDESNLVGMRGNHS